MKEYKISHYINENCEYVDDEYTVDQIIADSMNDAIKHVVKTMGINAIGIEDISKYPDSDQETSICYYEDNNISKFYRIEELI